MVLKRFEYEVLGFTTYYHLKGDVSDMRATITTSGEVEMSYREIPDPLNAEEITARQVPTEILKVFAKNE